ncbi:LamG-like jellyroll fold domain-containing protein [Deferrisoma camini]|uniref:LamG-like jellyroll fold domain-containing protein n=1 Tax=Deferrisoma camini TaxID=1035120 RepID=UPI00046CD7C4|nr:LamG-like jellyroll fold domain-containing protein [Deferrisoma camini]
MKRSLAWVTILLIWALAVAGCGGGGGGGSSSGGVSDRIVAGANQAILGPLVGAEVRAYLLTDLSTPVAGSVTTMDAPDLSVAGTFDLPLPGVDDEEWVLVEVRGGTDVDPDDDGVRDDPGTANQGAVRAVAKAKDVRAGVFVNALTEAAYQVLRSNLERRLYTDPSALESDLAVVAGALLQEPLEPGASEISYRDLLRFHPRQEADRAALKVPYERFLPNRDETGWVDLVHRGAAPEEFLAWLRAQAGVEPSAFEIGAPVTVAAQVQVPANRDGVTAEDVQITSFAPAAGEETDTEGVVVSDTKPSLVMAEDADGNTLLLSYHVPTELQNRVAGRRGARLGRLYDLAGETEVELSVRSTALALVMLRIGGDLAPEEKAMLAADVLAHEEFEALVSDLEEAYKADAFVLDRLMTYDGIVQRIGRIADDVFNAYVEEVTGESLSALQQADRRAPRSLFAAVIDDFWWGSVWDNDEPWTWYTDNSVGWLTINSAAPPFLAYAPQGNKMAVGNPTLTYYAMEYYRDTGGQIVKPDDWILVPRATSLIQKLRNSGAEQFVIAPRRDWAYTPREWNPEVVHVQFSKWSPWPVAALNVLTGGVYIMDILADAKPVKETVECTAESIIKDATKLTALAKDGVDLLSTISYGDRDGFLSSVASQLPSIFEWAVEDFVPWGCVREAAGKLLQGTWVAKIAGKISAKVSNPAGWAAILFDAANGLAPYTASVVGAPKNPGYDVVWTEGTFTTVERNDEAPAAVDEEGNAVYQSPVAAFTYQQQSGLTYRFDATGSRVDLAGTPSYTWTIEGVTYTDAVVDHTFSAAGEQTIRLRVEDGLGQYDEKTLQVVVRNGRPPEPVFEPECAASYDATRGEWRVGVRAEFQDPDPGDLVTRTTVYPTPAPGAQAAATSVGAGGMFELVYPDDEFDVFTVKIVAEDLAGNRAEALCVARGTTEWGAPTGLQATPGDGQVDLVWNAVEGATSYVIRVYDANGGLIEWRNTPSTFTTVTGLEDGKEYAFSVSAVDEDGRASPMSEAVTVTVGSGGGSSIPTDGLIAYYPFDGDADDASGNGYHGTLQGSPSFTADRSGVANGAIYLDGGDDFVSVESLNESTLALGDFTISLWYRADDDRYYSGLITSTDGSAWGLTGFSVVRRNSTFIIGGYRARYPGKVELGATVDDDTGEWHHVAMVRDTGNSKAYLYYDGVLVAESTDVDSEIAVSPQSFVMFGRYVYQPEGRDVYFRGALDEVRIYSTALSPEEIAQLARLNSVRSDLDEWILFDHFEEDRVHRTIWKVRPDGSELTMLTDPNEISFSPAMSHDGTMVAFSRIENSDDKADIYIMDPDGRSVRRLTYLSEDGKSAYWPSWSPDDTKIVFNAGVPGRGETYEIYTVDVETGVVTQLTNNESIDQLPIFHPQTGKIVFLTARNGLQYEIYVMNEDGSDQSAYLPVEFRAKGGIDFTQDGRYLVTVEHPYPEQLAIIDTNTWDISRPRRTDDVDDPTFSPDGSRVVIDPGYNNYNTYIYVMNRDGTGLYKVTDMTGHAPFWWGRQ